LNPNPSCAKWSRHYDYRVEFAEPHWLHLRLPGMWLKIDYPKLAIANFSTVGSVVQMSILDPF
jgi:hypothetical protein